MAMNHNGAGDDQGFHVISMKRARSLRTPAENDHSVVNLGAVAPIPAEGDSLPFTVGDSNPGKMKNLPPSSASAHEIGQGILRNLAAPPKSNSQLLDQHFCTSFKCLFAIREFSLVYSTNRLVCAR
jgi:hypothetical protein